MVIPLFDVCVDCVQQRLTFEYLRNDPFLETGPAQIVAHGHGIPLACDPAARQKPPKGLMLKWRPFLYLIMSFFKYMKDVEVSRERGIRD
jgi:hypothetical protein